MEPTNGTSDHNGTAQSPAASSPASNTSRSRPVNNKKRKHSLPDDSHSPGADDHNGDDHHDDHHDDQHDDRSRHAPKRACNECRQQKLRCDVVPEPFKRCSRCQRLKLECRIDANFKRVGKRSKNAEMEREIVELRQRLAEREFGSDDSPMIASPPETSRSSRVLIDMPTQPAPITNLHQGVAGSLLELRHGSDAARSQGIDPKSKRLDSIILGPDRIAELFRIYFQYYHPFLPVLDPDKTPEEYFELTPLLFWTVITVATRRYENDPTLLTGIANPLSQLVWATIAAVPHNFHVVKAMAILCTWPLPTKSTSTDHTFILSGIMMQIALQTGLHRPSHYQDFSRSRADLRDDDVKDRLRTWAVCNIVTQSVSTAYGQPPKSIWDYTLTSLSIVERDKHGIALDIFFRMRIERFCNKVSQKFYNNRTDPIGVANEQERAAWISLLLEEYRDLDRQLERYGSGIDRIYLQAAGLHLRLSAFFDSSTAPNYAKDLLDLYFMTTTFLKSVLELQIVPNTLALNYIPNYIMQMMLAGGFTLMKLLNSFFAKHINAEDARKLFSNTIWAIRAISITNNDLPARLAEVLAQLWRSYGAGVGHRSAADSVDSSLQLRVRCRMSMSLVYDSVWRWREEFQFKGDGTTSMLDSAVNNPTNPDVGDSNNGNNSTAGETTQAMLTGPNGGISAGGLGGMPTPGTATAVATLGGAGAIGTDSSIGGLNDTLAVDYNYDVFDPLTWMLDGSVDFPYNSAGEGLGTGGSMFG